MGAAGPNYVLVRNEDGPGNVQTIDLKPVGLTFSLQNIGPNQGSNLGQVTLTVLGTGFAPDDGAVLQNGAGASRVAKSVFFKNPNKLFATFDLTGLETGGS